VVERHEAGDTGLPASFERAWGMSAGVLRRHRSGLSLERIVESAVHLAASEGLGAVSMARVAGRLGTAPMSLYRYVTAKDELVELMVDAATGPPPPDRQPGEAWRSALSRWAWAQREVDRRHPWMLRVPVTSPPFLPNGVAWFESGLGCLAGTGLTESEKLSVLNLVSGFVRAAATLSADVRAAVSVPHSTAATVLSDYGRLLATLTDADRFPALHAVIASGALDAGGPPDSEFVFGLERLLDGVAAIVRPVRRAAPSAAAQGSSR
jgi:AcrR family transcriptional regulator